LSSAKTSVNEIKSLTGLRGVAAIYVVVFHFLSPSPLHAFSNPFKTFVVHGYLAVDLFFILSGFVMALNYSRMFASGWSMAAHRKFLGRRIARIYPLYFAATIAGFLLAMLGWVHSLNVAPPGLALLLNVLMVQVWGCVQSFDSPGWSISAEWFAYLIFPLLVIPTLFRKPLWGWALAGASAMILALLSALPASFHLGGYPQGALLAFSDPWFALPLLRCVPEFMLGLLAYRLAATPFGQSLGSRRWLSPVLCLAGLALLATPGMDLAVVLLFPLLVISVASGTHAPSRVLGSPPAQLLGTLSYSVYLTHFLMVGVLQWVYAFARTSGLAHAHVVAAAVVIPLTFAVAYIAYRCIEVPGRQWLRVAFEGRLNDGAAASPARVAVRPA
jgi:peptidoglycan/LPS O-acetylase OafA/YrhL